MEEQESRAQNLAPADTSAPALSVGTTYPSGAASIPVAIGVDLIERGRLLASYRRYGERMLHRIFTEREIAQAGGRIERLVGRFAAKEACSKALGTGMITVAWREIEIERGNGGKPIIRLHGRAAERAAKLGLTAFDVSISDTHDHAIAVVVALGLPK
ncbi:MAG TPA: holo-ACP synthase [Ktedonobacterales bacterium]|nr:holo-ACP synthase [Ktedonobacterales bacterium]